MRPASGIQLVVRNGASVLVWSVGRQVFRSHTGGVLKRRDTKKEEKKKQKGTRVGNDEKGEEDEKKTRKRRTNKD